jgi:AraC-like DNA-binding protein
MPTEYSTESVAARYRFEYWKEVVCRHCIPASSKPLDENKFDGQLHVRGLGALDVCTVSSSMHHWERTPQHLRTGPDEDLWLGFLQNGYGQLEQGGRKAVLVAENLMLYDASQTFRFSLGGNNNHLVRIPRHLLSMRLNGVENLTAMVLDDQRPGVIPLREMLRQVVTAPPILENPDFSARFSQTLLDLLALSLEVQNVEKANDERDLYSRIMIYIQKNLTNQELSVEQIASFHHVSTRTVTRAFARHQKSPMSVLWHERLLASRNAIERGQARSVSQVALDYGFSDFSHFSHAFRKAFGVSPQTLLRRD